MAYFNFTARLHARAVYDVVPVCLFVCPSVTSRYQTIRQIERVLGMGGSFDLS